MNLLTTKEVMDKYHYSDAVILDGNQILIHAKRGFAFIKQQSDKKKRHLAGLE